MPKACLAQGWAPDLRDTLSSRGAGAAGLRRVCPHPGYREGPCGPARPEPRVPYSLAPGSVPGCPACHPVPRPALRSVGGPPSGPLCPRRACSIVVIPAGSAPDLLWVTFSHLVPGLQPHSIRRPDRPGNRWEGCVTGKPGTVAALCSDAGFISGQVGKELRCDPHGPVLPAAAGLCCV